MRPARFLLPSLVCLSLSFFAAVRAADDNSSGSKEKWPDGLVLMDHSTSPDGHYGILVHSGDGEPRSRNEENEYRDNRIADLEKHRILSTINDAWYLEGGGAYLTVYWLPDSSACTLHYFRRHSEGRLTFFSPAHPLVQRHLLKDVSDEAKKIAPDLWNTTVQTDMENGEFRVFGMVTNQEDGISDDPKARFVAFAAAFDASKGKWRILKAARISRSASEKISGDLTCSSDERLNTVYQVLKALMPSDKFAVLRDEQRAWLQGRKGDEDKDSKRTYDRSQKLEGMLWKL